MRTGDHMNHLMNTYARMPVDFVSGKGAYLEDSEGNTYLDGLTGIAVCGLGHAHPEIATAIAKQAATLVHTSNLYQIPLQTRLADRLCSISGMDNAFFCNSGAEANEAAIKLARLKGNNQGLKTPRIIVVEGSFHGRTMATLTATGSRKAHAGFEPLLSGFVRAPFNDILAIEKIAENDPNVVGILVEPILGEGGIYIPDPDYLSGLRRICDDHNWLLMLDEVQSGNARTGKYFAFQHSEILPDVLTTAKGLGNGMPIGACLASGEAATLFAPGNHGSTFGGNLLACAAAHAVLDIIQRDEVEACAEALGERIVQGFKSALAGNNQVKEIRGKGLMLAVEMHHDIPDFTTQALHAGLLINVTQGNIVRMLPPLTMTEDEADELVEKVSGLLNA